MSGSGLPDAQLAALETALPSLRPELHRYCARMTGSVIDGEDVLQDALFNATRAIRGGAEISELRPWLFRIAHNTALNHFRSGKKERDMKEQIRRDGRSHDLMPKHSEVADTLRPFLKLTPKQRSTVILRDVLGYSAKDVAGLTDSSVPSVKSALHRGRSLLKDDADQRQTDAPPLPEAERLKLALYARYFNAHDFDRLREMLSGEVRLELVSREQRRGKKVVGRYFSNYQMVDDWVVTAGSVEGRPALLVADRDDPDGPPGYFVLLTFSGAELTAIRDFRYAPYVMADARWERF